MTNITSAMRFQPFRNIGRKIRSFNAIAERSPYI